MVTETTYDYAKALSCAMYIFRLLQPHCERIHVAGSIRRLKQDVKDIEIVCEPKKIDRSTDLFGGTEKIPSHEFATALHTVTKEVIKGNIKGRYMQIITNSITCPDIKLDLFMPRTEDYYRQYAIRTGSAEYARHMIANAWSRKGWVGINGDLFKKNQCDVRIVSGKKVYSQKASIKNPEQPPAWKSEAEFFAWLDIPYMEPQHRIISHSNEAL